MNFAIETLVLKILTMNVKSNTKENIGTIQEDYMKILSRKDFLSVTSCVIAEMRGSTSLKTYSNS